MNRLNESWRGKESGDKHVGDTGRYNPSLREAGFSSQPATESGINPAAVRISHQKFLKDELERQQGGKLSNLFGLAAVSSGILLVTFGTIAALSGHPVKGVITIVGGYAIGRAGLQIIKNALKDIEEEENKRKRRR